MLIGGLPAFYACQAKQTGWVGLVGVVALGMTELLLVVLRFFLISLAISDTKGLPTSVLISILAVGIAQTISFIFLAIAIMRSRVFPIWLAWTLIASLVVGWVGFFLPNLVGTVLLSISDLLYYLSIARIGWLLITQFANAAAKPPLSSLETTE